MKGGASLTTRRNLWRSRTEENKYSRDLRNLVAEYGSALQEALQRAAHTGTDGTSAIDLTAFSAELERIQSALLATKGEDIVNRHAKDSMMLGIRYSDRTLKEAGIDDSR